MRRKKRVTEPLWEDMIEVNDKNRKRLENRYRILIPDEVTYIIPPDRLLEESFWRNMPTGVPHFEELIG